MTFNKSEMMDLVTAMMTEKGFATSLENYMQEVVECLENFRNITKLHMDNVKELTQKMKVGDLDKMEALNCIKEVVFLGFIAKQIRNYDDIFKATGFSEQFLLADQCLNEYVKGEVERYDINN